MEHDSLKPLVELLFFRLVIECLIKIHAFKTVPKYTRRKNENDWHNVNLLKKNNPTGGAVSGTGPVGSN